MSEGSLTRAAEVLAITQPAASHALKRLNEAVGEALFVRNAFGMTPTPRAEALWPQVRSALAVAAAGAGARGVRSADAGGQLPPGHDRRHGRHAGAGAGGGDRARTGAVQPARAATHHPRAAALDPAGRGGPGAGPLSRNRDRAAGRRTRRRTAPRPAVRHALRLHHAPRPPAGRAAADAGRLLRRPPPAGQRHRPPAGLCGPGADRAGPAAPRGDERQPVLHRRAGGDAVGPADACCRWPSCPPPATRASCWCASCPSTWARCRSSMLWHMRRDSEPAHRWLRERVLRAAGVQP